jgi:hypothetical protein
MPGYVTADEARASRHQGARTVVSFRDHSLRVFPKESFLV